MGHTTNESKDIVVNLPSEPWRFAGIGKVLEEESGMDQVAAGRLQICGRHGVGGIVAAGR